MKFNISDITVNNEMKSEAKTVINDNIDLYKLDYITFTECITAIAPYITVYQDALRKEKLFIDSTVPFSEERLEVCKLIA